MKKILKTIKKAGKTLVVGLGVSLAAYTGLAMAASDKPGDGVAVTPIFSSVSAEHFRGEVVNIGLRELGYKVKSFQETEYATMFIALSYGDADFTVHMWDKLHDTFYQKAGGDSSMIKTGTIIADVSQGYLIDKRSADKYNITSLTDLKRPEIAKLFDSNGDGKADLTGCNPGWGCELVIEHHMKAYGLSKTVTHNQGSYFALMADTIARFGQREPILYYTWAPQWVAGVLIPGKDVVYLPVPHTDLPDGNNTVNTTVDGKNLGFAVDQIRAVVNREFAEENPAAATFIGSVQIPANDESSQNLKMEKGEKRSKDVRRHATEWVTAHRTLFDGWLEQARTAAK